MTLANSVKYLGKSSIEFKNLEKLTMPGNVKYRSTGEEFDNDLWNVYHGNNNDLPIKTKVYFTSNLNVSTADRLCATQLNVYKKDKNFVSKNGIVFTKDMKTVVRIPTGINKQVVKIPNGPTTLSINAIDCQPGYGRSGDEMEKSIKIEIPASITKIDPDSYKGVNSIGNMAKKEELFVYFDTKNLDGESISLLYWVFNGSKDDTLKKLKALNMVSEKDGFVYTKDGVLITYEGTATEVTVPDNINTIGYGAFATGTYASEGEYYNDTNLTKVVLPASVKRILTDAFYDCNKLKELNISDSITEIGNYALYSTNLFSGKIPASIKKLGKSVYACSKILEVNIPSSLKKIPEETFGWCDKLEKINIPEGVTEIGKGAFAYCGAVDLEKSSIFPSTLKTVRESAFEGISWDKLELPATITRTETNSFTAQNGKMEAHIKGYNKNVSMAAFANPLIKLSFDKNTYSKTAFTSSNYKLKKKTEFSWVNVAKAKGYEIQISNNTKYKNKKKKNQFKKSILIKKNITSKKISFTTKQLKDTLYIRIRPYVTSGKKKVYGKWSDNTKFFKSIRSNY